MVGPNCFDHNPDYETNELCTGIRAADCADCTFSGLLIQDCQSGRHTVKDAGKQVREALFELIRCRRLTLSGVQILEGAPYGLYLEDCVDTLLSGCTILDGRAQPLMQAAIRWKGRSAGSQIGNCRLGKTPAEAIQADEEISQVGNLIA